MKNEPYREITDYPAFIEGMTYDEILGRHHLSFRVGYYCKFDDEAVSNQLHFHRCYELCMILDGKGTYIHGKEKYDIKKGDIIIADPLVEHEIRIRQDGSLYLIYFFVDITKNIAAENSSINDSITGSFLSGHKPHAEGQLHMLSYLTFITEYSGSRKTGHHWVTQTLKNFLLDCLENLTVVKPPAALSNSADKDAFLKALDLIYRNLHNKIMIPEVAKYCCTSVRNLYYIFRKNTGKTVSGFINEKKMDLAAHYININFSLSEAARMVGVADPSRFTRLFKKYRGVTPKKYQLSASEKYKNYGMRLVRL